MRCPGNAVLHQKEGDQRALLRTRSVVSASLMTECVFLGKILSSSGPQWLHLHGRNNQIPMIPVKCFSHCLGASVR